MIRSMWYYFNFLVLLGGPKVESGRSKVSRFVERLRCVDVCHGYTLCQCAQLSKIDAVIWLDLSFVIGIEITDFPERPTQTSRWVRVHAVNAGVSTKIRESPSARLLAITFHRWISEHGCACCHSTIADFLRWNCAQGTGESIFDRLQK